jgi:hypothetical protein
MPNWVDNALTIQGTPEELARFSAQAATTYTSKYMDFVSGDMKMVEQEVETQFSFWNFVRPDDSIIEEYWGAEPRKASLEEALRHEGNHWYDWNVRNWGCKWDASEPHLEESTGELAYYFNTPWGPPSEALAAMSNQYPELVMTMRSVEEQGWGVEYIADQDGVRLIKEWDIPDTHEDSMKHKGWCNCEEMRDDEMEWMYEDCPKKKELANA